MKEFLKKLASTILREGALLALIVAFSCVPLQATDKTENEVNLATKKFSAPSLQNLDSLASKEKKDPFEWQNAKHYESVVKIFEDLADREFSSIIDRIVNIISTEHEFFNRTYEYLISKQQTRILDWMNEHVLTRVNYRDELTTCRNYDDTSDDSNDEAPLTRMYIRAYEGGDEDEHSSSSSVSSSDDSTSDTDDSASSRNEFTSRSDDRGDGDCDGYFSLEEIDEKQEDEAFQYWQVRKLESMLGISVDSMAEFTEGVIDIDAIKIFLQKHCEGGYSWLLNEDVEGSLFASEDFASDVHEKLGLPEDLIANILGALWFDYDWEEFEIEDPQFLQKTYMKTLEALKTGKRAKDVKKSLLKRVSKLFAFNEHDFESPLKEIHKRYLKFNKRKNWLRALIEWSVYSTYRKVFANPAKRSKINGYATVHPALPVFQSFNREKYLLDRLNAAYMRANAKYTKVYPHHDTKKIVFGPAHPNRAELDL